MKKLLINIKGSMIALVTIPGCVLLGYLLTINAYAVGKFAETAYPHYGHVDHIGFIWVLMGRVSLGLFAILIGLVIFVVPVGILLGVVIKAIHNLW